MLTLSPSLQRMSDDDASSADIAHILLAPQWYRAPSTMLDAIRLRGYAQGQVDRLTVTVR